MRGGEGLDIAPLTDDWMQDLAWLNMLDGERERKRADAARKRPPGGSIHSAFSFEDDEDFDD